MKDKIYYIGYYHKIDNPSNFQSYPAANTKIDYIIRTIKQSNFNLEILALGETKSINKFYKANFQIIDKFEKIKYISTFSNNLPILKLLSRLFLLLQVLKYLLFVVPKNSVVIVYHSYSLILVIKLVRYLKKIKLIFELEEIYQAAWKGAESKFESEKEYLNNADGYIFVNDIIGELCGIQNKPNVVCYGSYQTVDVIPIKDYSGKIELVYAGVLGDKKSDIYLALNSMRFLSGKYVLNILGYGSKINIEQLKIEIDKLNLEYDDVKVIFHGKLIGEEYLDFLKTCHIGLSTRVLEDKYSNFTFPSKLLVYLSNNLATVSSQINCITKSKVADHVYFYKSSSPDSVADAIKSINFDEFTKKNQVDMVNQLNSEFIFALKILLKKFL